MSNTIERPSWATQTEYEGDGTTPYVYTGVIYTAAPTDGMENVGAGYPGTLEEWQLIQGAGPGDSIRMGDPYGIDFNSPGAMRAYAEHLVAAAQAWETAMDGAK